MDNKLTKKRLSDLLSYDWILILVVIAAAVIVWELVFSIAAVRLTSGQEFKFYCDENLYANIDEVFLDIIHGKEDDPTFSYDVLKFDSELLNKDYNVLSVRLSVYEGDVIFTDSVEEENGSARTKTIVDNLSVYRFDKLLSDGKNYLSTFLKEGVTGEDAVYDYNNLDENKIKANFLTRMRKDNRFRTEAQKEEGLVLEKARIKKVCRELEKFNYLLTVGEEKGLFYRYTRFEQTLATAEERTKEQYQAAYDREVEGGRKDAVYGINLGKLKGGAKSISQFIHLRESDSAENVVLMAFDFYDVAEAKLYDLQFETVSFINRIVDEFSDVFTSRGN